MTVAFDQDLAELCMCSDICIQCALDLRKSGKRCQTRADDGNCSPAAWEGKQQRQFRVLVAHHMFLGVLNAAFYVPTALADMVAVVTL